MSKAQFRILMLLTVFSGLVGGALSDWLFRGLPARAASPRVIEAQEFRLVDEKGEQMAALSVSPWGDPALMMWDTNRQVRAMLTLLPGGSSSLTLNEAAGKRSSVLRDDGLYLSDAEGDVRMMVTDQPRIALVDAGGNMRTLVSSSSLILNDAAGNSRVVVGCTETVNKNTGTQTKYPESTVTLFKENGDVLWQAP